MNRFASRSLAAFVLFGVFLTIYLPDIGHGFVRDDYGWIRNSRLADGRGLLDLFRANVGFYRPLVSLTFAADYAIWGMRPFGFALTNLCICLAGVGLLYALARRLSLPPAAAVVACGVWALNVHGINMALLWISGRTALLVVVFALLTAVAMLRQRIVLAGLCALLAMLCKEEAMLLPALWSAVAWTEHPTRRSAALRPVHVLSTTWPLWLALMIYLALRWNSGAFGASDAPSYYRFSFDPRLVARNIVEYADRAATVAAAVSIVLLVVAGRRQMSLERAEVRTLKLAVIWLVASFALTVFLPVRSSLYAVLPSIGSALAAGAIAARTARAVPERLARTAAVFVVAALVSVPLYHRRNERLVLGAELTARTIDRVRAAATQHPAGGVVALVENADARVTYDAAFGVMLPDALALTFGPQWTGQVWAPGASIGREPTMTIRLQRDGTLTSDR